MNVATGRKLRGHKNSISCLQVSADGCSLISASEDKTVRVWDVASAKPIKCFTGCFDTDVESIRFGTTPGIIYVACLNGVVTFNMNKEGIIVKEPVSQVVMSDGGDEVSTIALNSKGDLLAVAMESGVINLLPVKPNGTFCENAGATRFRRLTRMHTNIVNTVTFKRTNPKELLSGGFDYTACVWETDRGKPKVTTNFTALPMDDNEEPSGETATMPLQMVNPPFVMAMEYVLGGRCIVAALGDGTVRVLNAKDLTLNTAWEAHHCMITAFFADATHVVTGGTDSMIHAFKLVTNESSSSVASGHNNSKGAAGAGGKKKHAQPAPLPKLEVQVVPLFSIAHDRKVNALACVFSPHTTVAAECSSTAAVVPAIASPANEVPPPPAIEEAATAVAVVDSMEPTSMTAETTAAEAAVKVIAATAGIEDKVPAFPASAPAQLPSDTNTAVAPMGMQCRCYVADTSNDITVYMRTF